MEVKPPVERKLEKSGRITPREVLEAYRQTGLKPARGLYLEHNTACALTAVVVAARGLTFTDDEGAELAIDELLCERIGDGGKSSEYVTSFMSGFDGNGRQPWARAYGYHDGYRARRFVFGRDDG